MAREGRRRHAGFTLIEALFVLAITATLAAAAVPQGVRAMDDFRTRSAAQYLAHRLASARFQAIRRSAVHGLRFESSGADYRMSLVADGNRNGLRTAELRTGVDRTLSEAEPLSAHFAGVSFGILADVPDADGNAVSSADGVRVGASKLVAMDADGTASPGTLYVHGASRSQYAVRVLGSTGRVRILRFDMAARRWTDLR